MRFFIPLCLLFSSSAFAADGLLTASIGIPVDSASAGAAVRVAAAAREAIASSGELTVIDLEALLDATDAPPAVAKLAEAKRLKDKADLGLSMVRSEEQRLNSSHRP